MMIIYILIAHLNTGCCVAQLFEPQLAICLAGERCRNTDPVSFGVIEQCCNSSDILRSYTIPGTEACDDCRCKYILIIIVKFMNSDQDCIIGVCIPYISKVHTICLHGPLPNI